MSGKAERTKRREQREREEAEAQVRERRKRLVQLGSGAAFLAVCVVAVLIVVSQSQTSGGDSSLEGVAEVNSLLHGLEQRQTVLGDPNARATIVEFGDLQCPVCKAYSTTVVKDLINGPVRAGQANLEFRNWTIIGSQSTDAAKAALAAAQQGRYWSFVELFYRNQGVEESGYVTDDFLTSIAKGAGVSNLAKWNRDRKNPRFDSDLTQISNQAEAFGFSGTPSFAVVGPNGTKVVGTPQSATAIESAIQVES